MKKITYLIFLLSFILISGCSSQKISVDTPSPAPAITLQPDVPTDTVTVPTPTQAPANLTIEKLKNLEYQLNSVDTHPIVKLENGAFKSTDGTTVNLLDQIALKDLNGDGLDDAAVLIGENFGGTGTFVSLIVFLNQNGEPLQSSGVLIDDRPKVNSIKIEDGQIILDAVIHGFDDPMCCPNQPVTRTYRLGNNGLVMTSQTSPTSNGLERVITIDQPVNGSEVSGSVQVKGTVTVSPFENNLVYAIYNEKGEELARGPFAVQSDGMGSPGTFDNTIDLSAIPTGSAIRLELSELSMADGSLLTMDSVDLVVK